MRNDYVIVESHKYGEYGNMRNIIGRHNAVGM